MRNGFLGSLLALLCGTILVQGQTVEAPETSPVPAFTVSELAPDVVDEPFVTQSITNLLWFNADYLMWWTKSGPVVPLVTTGSFADPQPGVLGAPNTSVLFGDSNLDYGLFAGMRLGGGIWIAPRLAVEASYFLLEKRSQHFSAIGDGAGNPLIGRPIINDITGNEILESDSVPGRLAGGIAVSSSSRVLGWEINVVGNLVQARSRSLDLLLGFRALDLNESLEINERYAPLMPGLTFLGAQVAASNSLTDFDRFQASNRFYGPQLGGKFDWTRGRFTVGVVGKVALGTTLQAVDITGATALVTPAGVAAVAPGGVLALPSNIGHHYQEQFTVVPEVGLNLGVYITPRLTARVGYTFLYWSDVVRPGAQVDRRVSLNQVPSDTLFGVPGPSNRPAFAFRESDYWAQGLNFGLEFRY